MAYQFFAKAHQSKAPTSPPLSAPQTPTSTFASNSTLTRQPVYQANRLSPNASNLFSVKLPAKMQPPSSNHEPFEPTAYPQRIASGHPTPHPHVTIEVVSTAHIPSLTRITGLLLPIRYPNSFYTATITDPVIASLSRVAIYHDHPVAAAPASASPSSLTNLKAPTTGTDKVIGGIRCRLERLPSTSAGNLQARRHSQQQEPSNLYIQTLHLLSPYRGCGVAASLLNSLLYAPPSCSAPATPKSSPRVSDLVKHYNIRTVTAHVHEANEDGLKWYLARGFQLEEGVVENYYRRLKPSGARIVKLVLQWNDDEHVHVGNQNQYWEKVEAEDEHEDHGVQPLLDSDSKLLEVDGCVSRKRKADEEHAKR
ncbi:GNAT family N-acetyltransferase [Aspergillus saccharolyticus JOP 1030-1]|uniref:Putative GNAT family acetyltransferase n=1 Tax=Aspergillus saccharolyticus JOP 1030-1 TaxID=1450539 RepID=A0A318ZD14_9EURO|nr:putative GNAT family acetyltransferase [Aspergillus saccharolyticus JOP 1030-1]PYH45391.1 putative GNAT family acetyltransferase [Aspergillus saccharolyticus JOP 1030-1]